jgi:hypothetical protein
MRPRQLILLTALALALSARPLLSAPSTSAASVKINKTDVAVDYKHFDPYHPPTPPPPLDKGEAAVTVYRFGVEVDSKYSYTQPANAPAGPLKLDVTVEEINVKLTLSITIWLPDNASRELAAHEEGHRWIAERFYSNAEQVARPMAAKWVGKKLPGEGHDAKAAARSAIDRLSRQLCQDYLDSLNPPCEKAQAVYDHLTDHGRNVHPSPQEAMERALEGSHHK